MDSRERITSILSLEEPDRVGYVDSVWSDTIERWKREGLPETHFLQEYFGMDIYCVSCNTAPRYDEIVYEEAKDWRIVRDQFGVKAKFWRPPKSGVPFVLDPPVRNLDDFREKIEPAIDPEDPTRISSPHYPFRADIEQMVKRFQERFFVALWLVEPFEYCRHLCGGIPQLLTHMVRRPDFVSYMFNSVADFMAEIGKRFIDAGVDGLWAGGDIAYKNGPFFSPELYRKLLQPAHRRMFAPFRRRRLPVIYHCDGNVNLLIPDLIEAGITALQPLEVKAGMDVRELKERYGDRLALMGNIDVRVLSSDNPDEIRGEVATKTSIAGQGGGYVIGSDHSIPPSVSLRSYRLFLKAARKYGTYPLRAP